MSFNDTPQVSALTMDRGTPIGMSPGDDGRGRLHTKISNTVTEPVPVNDSTTQADINAFASQNHTDLTKIDTDVNAFATQNHGDLGQLHSDNVVIEGEITSFSSQNHTDLAQIDTDLVAFKAANHIDITTAAAQNHTDLATVIANQTNKTQITQNAPIDGLKETYSASIQGLVVAATPTDVFTINGSATKTVRVTRIGITASQNTSAIRDVILLKRSTANSGGSSTILTNVPHDSNDVAGTAVVKAYTVDPTTLGTLIGYIRATKMDISATNLVGSSDRTEWLFGNGPSKAIVLRGVNETLAINLNSVTLSNNSFDMYVEWTEET